ncbi:prepilin peptidase [Bacteroidota bacterium]
MEKLLVIILISASFGSFANNIISYFTGRSKFDFARSYCLCGKKRLSFSELLPILSYLKLRGKCKSCEMKIPVRYFLVEILTIVVGILCYHKYGWTIDFIISFTMYYILLLIGVIDLLTLTIPNKLTSLLFIIVLIKYIDNPAGILPNFVLAISLLVILSFTNIIAAKVINKNVIGFGDIKLLFVLFLIFQFPMSLMALWISSILGITVYAIIRQFNFISSKQKLIPFGLFLSIGFVIVDQIGAEILNTYLLINNG